MLLFPLFPVFVLLALFEAIWIERVKRKAYSWRDSRASLLVAIGHFLSLLVSPLVLFGVPQRIWAHRIHTFEMTSTWEIVLLFFLVEFLYYWMHRASHEVRWLWAGHAVHHSSNEFNFSAAYRLSWIGWLSGVWLFFLPLNWLGFPPIAVGVMLSLNLAYQFFLHTELAGKLGMFERFLNTPSHHRVHHATNECYLDRNYGGVLIVFDRLFGTYREETVRPRYGLVKPTFSHSAWHLVFDEWIALASDLLRARSARERLSFVFLPPGRAPIAHSADAGENPRDDLHRYR